MMDPDLIQHLKVFNTATVLIQYYNCISGNQVPGLSLFCAVVTHLANIAWVTEIDEYPPLIIYNENVPNLTADGVLAYLTRDNIPIASSMSSEIQT